MNKKISFLCASICLSTMANAEISLNKTGLVVDAKEGEGTIIVTNTGSGSVLLHAEEIKEDTERLSGGAVFVVTPTISNIEPGKKQLLRVIMLDDSLDKQKISRLRIQEIPFSKDSKNKLMVSQSYNIPALAHPKSLEINETPWENLTYKNMEIINNSKYLVKMLPDILCGTKKGEERAKVESSYALPNSKLKVISNQKCDYIKYKPVSNSGRIIDLTKLN